MTGKEVFNAWDSSPEEELAEDGRPAGVEADAEGRPPQEPFDPEAISIDPKVVPMDTLIRRLLQGTIRLAPAFQRKMIWDQERKSQLIESLMLKIPIPMFYVAGDEKGNWDVVDGLQRLTAIKEFVLGAQYLKTREARYRGRGMQLQGLEFWGDRYDGHDFSQLPELLVNRILETEFRFTIINPGTPEEVKRNIFKRINTGGMPLTAQEIRHALYQGKSTNLLAALAESQAFKSATHNSVNDSRMAAREMVLRFLAFSVRSYEFYPKNSDMDKFLSDTMRLINIMPELPSRELKRIFKGLSNIPPLRFTDAKKLEARFKTAMHRCKELFGGHAFRKSYGRYRRSPINKTLFEVWANLLADLDENRFSRLMAHRDAFLERYSELLDDRGFGEIISRNSWKYQGVRARYEILQDITKEYTTIE